MPKLTDKEMIVALRGHPVWSTTSMFPGRTQGVDDTTIATQLQHLQRTTYPPNCRELLTAAVAEIESGVRRCCVCGGIVNLHDTQHCFCIGLSSDPVAFVHGGESCFGLLTNASICNQVSVYATTDHTTLAKVFAAAQTDMRKHHTEKMVPFVVPAAVAVVKAPASTTPTPAPTRVVAAPRVTPSAMVAPDEFRRRREQEILLAMKELDRPAGRRYPSD